MIEKQMYRGLLTASLSKQERKGLKSELKSVCENQTEKFLHFF